MDFNTSQFDIPVAVMNRATRAAICTAGAVPRHLLIADMSQPSIAARLWVLDLSDRAHPQLIMRTQVAHGFGSDPKRDGVATRFGNLEGSSMTSLGFYSVGQKYVGKHGGSYRLAGLSSTNSAAFARNIMLHPATYVGGYGSGPLRPIGRSAGCAAVATSVIPALEKRWGTIEGAYLWIDGQGAPSVTCAAVEPLRLPWSADFASVWLHTSSPRACTTENRS